ncbi:hypothetical protein CDAR_109771 [Caerostris darwini]|uniref:Uncharacterized protein n=1 Tax=Caerostris darwini TaxID=1538125 RepID=A0AAV4SW40_9ARAC|nr:hypothetical protein CDAR_109771 [Caerostris darwini]
MATLAPRNILMIIAILLTNSSQKVNGRIVVDFLFLDSFEPFFSAEQLPKGPGLQKKEWAQKESKICVEKKSNSVSFFTDVSIRIQSLSTVLGTESGRTTDSTTELNRPNLIFGFGKICYLFTEVTIRHLSPASE